MTRFDKRLGYVTALVATLVVLAVRMALNDTLAEQARLMPFVLAVMAAAWVGGLGPGIVATVLATFLGVLYIVPPVDSLRITNLADAVNAFIFVLLGVIISGLCEALHKARLSEAEKQFRTLADSISQLVWMAWPNGNRFWFNRRWYDYSGATLEQLRGNGWQAYCDAAELPRVLESWRRALAQGAPWEDTYPLRSKDGELRWHLARAVPVYDARGEITCWFGTSTDIHDRITFEQALKEADARKDRFIATLAHELRNPLAPISNALQLWPHVASNPAEMQHLRTVMTRQVRQLVRLIDDLLDTARITSGRINLRPSRADLRTVLAGAVETVQPLIDSIGHHLLLDLPAEPLPVDGDVSRLTQVFANVLNNAVKYTARPGRIAVLARRTGSRCEVRIRDNGYGIPPNQLETVFDAFRQLDRPSDTLQEGLGIGLTLARQLVELHGGTIVAHSQGLGTGSEFVVTLPLAFADQSATSAPPAAPVQESGPGRRVLIVDDARESAETLAEVLRTRGHDAACVGDGQSAVEWALEHHPDVVLLDIAMPGLDGYETARRLRSHAELAGVAIIALTGYGQGECRQQALAAGCDEHLTKPADLDQLELLLHDLPDARATHCEAAHLAT